MEIIAHQIRSGKLGYDCIYRVAHIGIDELSRLYCWLQHNGWSIDWINVHYTPDHTVLSVPKEYRSVDDFLADNPEGSSLSSAENVNIGIHTGDRKACLMAYPQAETLRLSVLRPSGTDADAKNTLLELHQIINSVSGGMMMNNTQASPSMTPEKLAELAKEAMLHAYVPYSGYKVGAALLCADGTVYQGCNIENAAYGPTNCAERTAFFKAVYDGHRDFAAIAVCGGKDGILTGAFPPCGVCRQVMREFCGDDFLIHMVSPAGIETKTLAEILPYSFSPKEHMGI